jgi:hypothetical protein
LHQRPISNGFPPLFEINCALQYRASQTYEPSNRRIQPTQ